MYRTTFGKTFAMFDAMVAYVALTNPQMPSEASDNDARSKGVTMPDLDAVDRPEKRRSDPRGSDIERIRQGTVGDAFGGAIQVKKLSELPADTREMLEEFERGT